MSRLRRALLAPANIVAALALLAFAAGYLWLRSRSGVDPLSQEGMEALVARLGPWGPVAYALLLALTVVVSQLPGVPLTVAAGMVWGAVPAAAYSVAGGFLGALVAYYLGRTLGRSVVWVLTGKVVVLSPERGEAFLGLVVFATRLLPLLPFDLISYAAGLSGLSLRAYAPATLLGMMPSTLLLTSLGASFWVGPGLALGISALALLALLVSPWLGRRFGWLDGVLRFEEPDAAPSDSP